MSVLNIAWVPTGGLKVCYPQQIMTGKMEDNMYMYNSMSVLKYGMGVNRWSKGVLSTTNHDRENGGQCKMKMRRAVLSATSAPPVYTLM